MSSNYFLPNTFTKIVFCLLVAVNSSCLTKLHHQSGLHNRNNQSLSDSNKALVVRFYAALNDTNWTLAKTMVAEDYRHYFVSDTGFAFIPWMGFERGYRKSLDAFPDWKLTPIKIIAEDNYVAVLLKGEGTHSGTFAGIAPTKRKAGVPVMLFHELKDGKLIADWEMMNPAAFLDQLKKQ